MANLRNMLVAVLAWIAPPISVQAVIAPSAQADDSIFRVVDVAVDATAKNATDARELALAEGHAVAFERLITRIVPAASAEAVPRLPSTEIAPMVQSFEVANEKTSRVRYLARLSFQFDRAAVRRFLRKRGIPFAETRGNPTLVLPVFRSAGAFLLWDEPNLWRESWANLPETGDLVPLLTPLGELQDVRDISAAQAMAGDPARLRAIAARYQAEAVVVALASLTRGADGVPVVQVSLTLFGENAQEQTIVESYAAAPGETVDQHIQTAAFRAALRIQDEWKARHLLRFDQEAELDVVVPISGIEEWVRISRALSETPSIEQSQVLSLSRARVRLKLRYFGDEARLISALREKELSLSREDDAWVLRSGTPAHGPGQPGQADRFEQGEGAAEQSTRVPVP